MKYLATVLLALSLCMSVHAESTVRVTVVVWGVAPDGSDLKPLYGAQVYIFGRLAVTGAYGVAEMDVPEQHGDGTAWAYFPGFGLRPFPVQAGEEKAGGIYVFPLVRQ